MSARRVRFALALFALLLAPVPVAQAAGVNLSWNDCGVAGTELKSFACDTNTGASFVLVGSYIPYAGSTAITGNEVVIDIASQYSPLPDWWKFKNAGSCRQTAISASADFTSFGSGLCADYWSGLAAGGISAYITPYASADCRARLLIIFATAIANAGPVDENLEYYSFRLSITRAKTVGTGSCAHCLAPAMIVLDEIKLTQPAGVGDYRIQNPANRNFVEWQGGYSSCGWVPTRNTTWGAIKSQYR